MDRLEEDLTCSVCYSLFKDPRVLPCSHTFCKSCLDNLLQVSTNYSIWRPLRLPLKCPCCRSVLELPPTGTEALPSNVSLKAIIEKYQNDSGPRRPSCEVHQQPLNMFCVLDRQLICGLCLTIGQHQGHPIDDLQAAYIREKQTPSQLLARLSGQKWAQVCELGKQLEREKERCEGVLQQDRQEVLQFFQTLEGMLGRKKQAFLDALDKAGAEVAQAYDPLIYRVKELQEEQLDLVSLGSSVEDEESPLVFLDNVHVFRERVEEFIQAPLPSVLHLSLAPRAADYLQKHWPALTISSLDEAPVPKVSCCTRCCTQGQNVGGSGCPGETQLQLWSVQMIPVVLLLALLLITLWVKIVGGTLLGFSLPSSINNTVHDISSKLITSVWSSVEVLVASVQRSHVATMGEHILQQLAAFLKSLNYWSE